MAGTPTLQDPFAEFVIWRCRDWQPDGSEDAPAFRHDWDALLEQCRAAVARRKKAYPDMIRAGRIDSDLADRDLAAWRTLAAEWTWILTGQGEAPHLSTLQARIDAVALGIERVEAELRRRGTEALHYQRHLLRALAWHLGDGSAPPAIHYTARINHALGRVRSGDGLCRTLCPTCERRREDPATIACSRPDCGLPREQLPFAKERKAA